MPTNCWTCRHLDVCKEDPWAEPCLTCRYRTPLGGDGRLWEPKEELKETPDE